ncbi:hypothetical protein BTVI_143898 [Pitangus sulphuratus]|nr:hypothetical protein BTVI_143898 [Pitangus sulphuratus]
MERQAVINSFAIFLFCLLVPLGSSAPTEITKESKMTTGERLMHFTTEIKPLVSVIENQATNLLGYYEGCISPALQGETRLLEKSKVKDLVKTIPNCPAFHANCCALHHIYSTLQTLGGDMETICNSTARNMVQANLIQLRSTLRERAEFYTCRSKDLAQAEPSQGQPTELADTMSYIWLFLKKYKQIMQNTREMYSEAAV